MDFKVGDKVKVISLPDNGRYTGATLGLIGTVFDEKIRCFNYEIPVRFKGSYNDWHSYNKENLELVESEKKVELTSKFKVGDRVKIIGLVSEEGKIGKIVEKQHAEDVWRVSFSHKLGTYPYAEHHLELITEEQEPSQDVLHFLKSLDDAQKFIKEKSDLIETQQKTIEHLDHAMKSLVKREKEITDTLVVHNNWINRLEGNVRDIPLKEDIALENNVAICFESVNDRLNALEEKAHKGKEESIFDKYNSVTAFKDFILSQFYKRKDAFQDDYRLETALSMDGYWNIRIHFPQNPKLLSS